MQITTIPRTAVKNALDAIRLPLSTIGRLTGQADNQTWPPALMFEEFQASAKQFAGSVLRDQTLVEEGRIQSVKVSELRRSLELDLKAEATREQADVELAQQHEAIGRERQQVDQQAREREANVAQLKRETSAGVKAEAKRAAETVAKAEKIRQDQLAAADRAARLANADAESAALAKQKKAVASISKVTTLADAVETTKAKRKSN